MNQVIDRLVSEAVSEDVSVFHLGEPISKQSLLLANRIEQQLIADWPEWLIDFRIGFGQLLIQYQIDLIDHHQLADVVQTLVIEKAEEHSYSSRSVIQIPTCYDPRVAPDLLNLSEQLGLSRSEIVSLHQSETYKVITTGFAPGFAYLAETPSQLHVPRKKIPLIRIPPGSVAIAENQTAIYPKETPGGWHLIGRTQLQLASVNNQTISTVLNLGQTVRFVEISYDQFMSEEE